MQMAPNIIIHSQWDWPPSLGELPVLADGGISLPRSGVT